jgi:prevent-host-death family protein
LSQWQLQEAKQQFSRVVEQARTEGPQVVTRHGKEVAVVLDVVEYRRLRGECKDFKAFLIGPPYVDVDLPIERETDPGPDVEL